MKVNQPECSSSITRRNLEILLLREKKVPMTTIGKMYGISRERVRQILEKKVKSMIKQPTDKEKLILLFQEVKNGINE